MPSVIIIDDYDDIVSVLSEYLSMSSINVLARGHDGKEAVKLYKEHKPDVVLLDHMMPGYNGYYALQNILKINPNAKVIFLTANMHPELPWRLKEAGADAVLTKPIDMKHLVELIKTMQFDDVPRLSN